MAIKRNNWKKSNEAATIARTTEEFNILNETIERINDLIVSASGIEKEQLEVKKADLEVQTELNRARKNYAMTRFEAKYGKGFTPEDIANIYYGAQSPSSSNTSNIIRTLGGVGNIIIDSYTKLETLGYEKEFETVSAKTDILMAEIEALGREAVMAAQLTAKAYSSAINSSLSNLLDGINEGAYAAANNLIDISAQSKINQLEKQRIELEKTNTVQLRETQLTTTYNVLEKQGAQAMTTMLSEGEKLVGRALNNIEVEIFGFGFSTGEMPGAIAEATATLQQADVARDTAITQMQGKLAVQQIESNKKITEAQLKTQIDVEKEWINAAANVEKAWLQFAQKMEGGLLKSEAAANDMGLNIGFNGNQLDIYKHTLFETQVVVSKWGKNLEDMQKLQNTFQDVSGRNVVYTTVDFDTSFALDKLTGQEGLSAQLAATMEPFNHSIADSNEMFFEMYKNVSKIGLNGRKYLKELNNNLKLAEKFQFKNGTKGLMEMAKWAQNVRFNMNSMSSVLQNISEGGLEGTIESAAAMQVLGGNFAMGADPLAMIWERYNDPQALIERQNDQIKGMGSFNSDTGEVTFNMLEQMQLEQFAKYSGQSVEDLMNQQRQRIKGERMNGVINQSLNWTKDEISLITNKAQLTNGEWFVTMEDGTPKSVSQLSREDIHHIMPEGNDETLVNYVYDIRDMVTKLAEAKQYATSRLEADGLDEWFKQEEQRIQNVVNDFNTNYATYLSEFKEKMKLATESQQTMLSIMEQGNENIESAQGDILREGKNIAATLADVNTSIEGSLSLIDGLIEKYKQELDDYVEEKKSFGEQLSDTFSSLFPGHPAAQKTSAAVAGDLLHEGVEEGDISKIFLGSTAGAFATMKDGVVSGNNHPILTSASNITPINDGAVKLAKSHHQDTAIFAKTGGPFDKLFNGIFDRIDSVYNFLNSELQSHPDDKALFAKSEGPFNIVFNGSFHKINPIPNDLISNNIEPKYMQYILPTSIPNTNINNPTKPVAIRMEPLQINLNGRLELAGNDGNGGSIDIINELRNQPLLMRSLVEMVGKAIADQINGGKSELFVGNYFGNITIA